MRLRYLVATSFVLLALALLGCRRSETSNIICAIPRDPSGSLYVTQHAGMANAASRLGMKVYWNGPRGGDDTEQQIELVERAIKQRNAGIVLTPVAAFALDTVIQRALTSEIPVVILGPPIPFPADRNLSFVLTDVEQSGKLAADHICAISRKPGEVALIGVDPVIPGSAALASAFERALATCNSTIHVVVKANGAATFGQGEMTAVHILQENPDLTAIYALNSPGARGAAAALKAMHRDGMVRLVSNEPTLDLFHLLRQGVVDGLVLPNMRAMGEQSVENIVALHNHLPIRPVMYFAPVMITKSNVDTEQIQTLLRMDWR
jgi:ABC-type sugar transport system substrate-binding protein